MEAIHSGPTTFATKKLMEAAEVFKRDAKPSEDAFEVCDELFARVVDEWNRLKPQFLELKSQLS